MTVSRGCGSARSSEPWERQHGAGLVCALCAGPGVGEVLEHRMTHGVTVSLCVAPPQRSVSDQGRWAMTLSTRSPRCGETAGCLTPQRRACDSLPIAERVAPKVSERPCPGSYSWPQVREEAEQRWAAGHPPVQVMHELRQLHSGWSAVVPSLRTMRVGFRTPGGSTRRRAPIPREPVSVHLRGSQIKTARPDSSWARPCYPDGPNTTVGVAPTGDDDPPER